MIRKNTAALFTLVLIASVAAMMALTTTSGPGHAHESKSESKTKSSGLNIANAYIAGMEAGDIDALTELFVSGEKSSILENASNEGSWEYYRDHHLKPEMDVVKNFKFEIAQESEKSFGDTILVEQTGTFSVDVRGETHNYRVAVSYLMVSTKGTLQIAHLHWSSRPQK